jgi:hypothetical protein
LVCKNINPSPIKKIINKKVTLIVIKDHLPIEIRRLPNFPYLLYNCELLLFQIKNKRIMSHRNYYRHRDFSHLRRRELHPRVSTGIFFIVLGIALLIATNDLLGLGSVSSYFTWETAMIFIGVLLLLNLHFVGGVMLIALGVWFLKDHILVISPETFNIYYWPAVIGLVGLSFIISSLFKRNRKIDE